MKFTPFVLVALLFVACGDSQETVKSPSGIKITYFVKGEQALEPNNVLLFDASFVMQDGDTLSASNAEEPMAMLYDESTVAEGGLLKEVMDMLKIGDSVYFELPAKNLWEVSFQGMLPDSIGADEKIKVNLKIVQMMSEIEYQRFMMKQEEKYLAPLYAQEEESLVNYLIENKINYSESESGLRYVISSEGNGAKASVGNKVTVKYLGTLLNGNTFDQGEFSFDLGAGQVIPGWDEGIALLSKGGKATLYIPSKLAYRSQGAAGVIGPFASLKFEVEIIDIQ